MANGEVIGMSAAFVGCLATVAGAMVVFCMDKVKPMVFAFCMAASAGVMLFVAIAEMFTEANVLFVEANLHAGQTEGWANALAYLYTTVLFLAGWLLSLGFNVLVHRCLDKNTKSKFRANAEPSDVEREVSRSGSQATDVPSDSFIPSGCMGGIQELSEVQKGELQRAQQRFDEDHDDSYRLGLFLALSLGLHNLPEGIAVFAGSVANPVFGAGIAVAICLHNVPEGFAVSVPIYHSTGSKWQGVGWALLTGLAEPLGAGLAWLFLSFFSDPAVYGSLFAFTAGIMAFVALTELFPTALRYDPLDRVCSWSLLGGIAVMAGSLVAIGFTEV